MKRRVILFVVALAVAGGVRIFAHHSQAAVYAINKDTKIEGEIAQILIRSPHSFVHVNAKNEKGEMVRDPAVPDLPTVYEVYQQLFSRKPDGLLRWKAYRALVAASWTYGRGLWVPEGTPPEALRALHDGIDRMNRDREFLDQAKKLMEGYPLLRGDLVEQQVHRSLRVTLDVSKFIKDLARDKYGQSI